MKTREMDSSSSSSSTSSDCAVSWNNRGAACVEEGDYSNAFLHFKQALDCSREMISTPEVDETTKEDDCDRSRGRQHDNDIHCQPQFGIDELMTKRSRSSSNDSGFDVHGDFMYQNVIHIDESFISSPTYNVDWTAMVSTVVVFNLALTHHLVAVAIAHDSAHKKEGTGLAVHNGGQSYKLLLRKASKLYKASMQILQNSSHVLRQQQQQHGGTASSSSIFFVASLLNNLGHVHQLLEEQVQSKHYYCQLVSTLMLVIEHRSSSGGGGSSHGQQRNHHHRQEVPGRNNRRLNNIRNDDENYEDNDDFYNPLQCFFYRLIEGGSVVAPAA